SWSRAPTVGVADRLEALSLRSPMPSPWLDFLTLARLDPERVDLGIEALLAGYRERGLPVLWWVGPATRPSDLPARLVAHGLVGVGEATGMAVDLAGLPSGVETPPGLTID